MNDLETSRLLIRRLTIEDAPFILTLLNDPSFIQNIGDRGVRTREAAESYIQNGAIESYKNNGFGLCLVELKISGTPIGICGLIKRDSLKDVDIGFAFLPQYGRRGYATESAQAVMEFGRKVLGLKRIVGVTTDENTGSIRILEKLGMKFEGRVDLGSNERDRSLKLYGWAL